MTTCSFTKGILNFALVSTETPLFVDRTSKLTLLSTRMVLFMDTLPQNRPSCPSNRMVLCIEHRYLHLPNFSREHELWKHLLQNRYVQTQHSSELLVGGVVAEVHLAGGVDLLLGAEL